jgi:hypothetical protein
MLRLYLRSDILIQNQPHTWPSRSFSSRRPASVISPSNVRESCSSIRRERATFQRRDPALLIACHSRMRISCHLHTGPLYNSLVQACASLGMERRDVYVSAYLIEPMFHNHAIEAVSRMHFRADQEAQLPQRAPRLLITSLSPDYPIPEQPKDAARGQEQSFQVQRMPVL